MKKIVLNRQPIGIEDLAIGLGTQTQTRGGVEVTVTQINAGNLPFDETRTLFEFTQDINIEALGNSVEAINNINNDLDKILIVEGNLPIINNVEAIKDSIVTLDTNIVALQNINTNMSSINTVEDNLPEVISVAQNIVPNLTEILNVDTLASQVTQDKASVSSMKLAVEIIYDTFESRFSVLNTVDEFGTVPSGIDTVIVKDINRGGTFIYDATQSAVNNGGTIFGGWVRQYSGAVNVEWFGAVAGATYNVNVIDSTEAIQLAVNSFTGIDGGEVFFPGKYRVDGTVRVTKAGTRFVGVSNRVSQLICRSGTLALDVEILYGSSTNTAQEYCKFGTDNFGVGASYYADGTVYNGSGEITSNTATGIRLRNVFSDSFNNLLTFGFNKHIEFDGVHLCTFNSINQVNMVQDAPGLPNFKTTIHNRGVGIIGSSITNPAGETGGVSNSFIGGWFENTCIDTTNLNNSIFQGIDFEPQCNTNIIGNGNIFRNNRFERFDIYSQADQGSKYTKFPWFQIDGDNNIFEDNILNWTGATVYSPYNLYVVNGDNNYIKLENQFNTAGSVKFGTDAKSNTLDFYTQFNDYINTAKTADYKYESCAIEQNNHINIINYIDEEAGRRITNSGSIVSGHGIFNRYMDFTDALNSNNWTAQGVNRELLPVSMLPDNRQNLEAFTKLTVTDISSNVGFQLAVDKIIPIVEAGVYTSTALIYVPSSTIGEVSFGTYYGSQSVVYPRDRWVFVVTRGYFEVGEYAYPGLKFSSSTVGDIAYIGEISLTKGHLGCYNGFGTSSITNPESPIKTKYPAIVSRTSAGVLAAFPTKILFSLHIKDLTTPTSYYLGTGYRDYDGTPIITKVGGSGIGMGATNSGGTITVIGTTDNNYIITVNEL